MAFRLFRDELGLKVPAGRNGRPLKEQPEVSELGRELERLRARYVASGGKLLNRRELEREIAERGASGNPYLP